VTNQPATLQQGKRYHHRSSPLAAAIMIVTTMILIMIPVMIMSFIFIVSVIIKAVAPQHNTTQHKASSQLQQLKKSPVDRSYRATTAIAAAVAEICPSATDAVVLEKERRDDARRRQTTPDDDRQTTPDGDARTSGGLSRCSWFFFFRAAQYSVDLPTTINNHSINYTYTKFSYYPPSYLPTYPPTYLPT
jgi:hypothetical protein